VADQGATDEADAARADLARQASAYQAQLDAGWGALLDCDSDTVLQALNEAFDDNEAAAAAVGVEGTEVSVFVVLPPPADLPERRASPTSAGHLLLKKLTKTETAELYKQLVCGHLLVTLRETFAVAPGIQSARIVALRPSLPDAYGNTLPEVIAAARCGRTALVGVRWDHVSAVQVLNDCCTDKIMVQKGVTGALQPIALAGHPELRALLEAVDMSELST
jgi:hypothetical protein